MTALETTLRWFVLAAATALIALIAFQARVSVLRANEALGLNVARLYIGDAPAVTRQLPDTWGVPSDSFAPRRYELRFDLPEYPPKDLFLYIPFFDPHVRIALNGVLLFNSEAQNAWSGPNAFSTALQLLPQAVLQEGSNTLEVTLFREGSDALDVPGRLSSMRLGAKEQLLGLFLLRKSFDQTLKPVLLGCQILLAIYGLFSFVLRPQDPVFGWLGLMMTLTSLLGIGAAADAIPHYRSVVQTVYLLAPAAGLALLGFSLSLAGTTAHRRILEAAVALTLVNAILQLGVGLNPVKAFALVSAPALLVGILGSAMVLVRLMWQRPRLELGLFLGGNLALILGLGHDLAAFFRLIDDGLMLGQATRTLSVAGLTVLIFRRQADTANALDRASTEQRRRLEQQERELAAYHAEEREKARSVAIEHERARITRDLHDGVASQLLTISALADSGPAAVAQIRSSARRALVDLKLVIDAMAVDDGDLRFFLGLFRERCVDPMKASGVDVDWSMTGIPMNLAISAEDALHVFRMLQEGLSNAVRHGDGTWIRVRGYQLHEDQLRITVQNRSGRPTEQGSGGGLGLISMRTRIAHLGGEIVLSEREGLHMLEMTFPVPADPSR
ncbi:MAG: sensor histidine kinase [Brevirhabdus sp.]